MCETHTRKKSTTASSSHRECTAIVIAPTRLTAVSSVEERKGKGKKLRVRQRLRSVWVRLDEIGGESMYVSTNALVGVYGFG